MIEQRVRILNAALHMPVLSEVAGSRHIVYYLFNAESMRVFGSFYYAPVAVNIVLTFLASAFMVHSARHELGLSKSTVSAFFLYLTLHPNIIVWSTIRNGKDTLILTATSILVYSVVRLTAAPVSSLMWAAGTCLVLLFTRYYLPVLFLSAFLISLILSPKYWRKPIYWVAILAPMALVPVFFRIRDFVYAWDTIQLNFVNPAYGTVRMLLTPIPLNAEAS